MTSQDLFAQVGDFPDPDAQARFAKLIGIDEAKQRVVAEASVLIDPGSVERWSTAHHQRRLRAVEEVAHRTPLIVLEGDVGTGKTEVAETFGDVVARQLNVDITFYSMSLSARGKGAVGEMTSLLSQAFKEVAGSVARARDSRGRITRGAILLVDEADALAQSRESAQMHHEDRAGVNALIRGIDGLRSADLPVLTVLCTNRLSALDPAVVRRAAAVLRFDRPNAEQRRALLADMLEGSGVTGPDLNKIVSLTGEREGRSYGCTYSDLRQRFVPEVVLDAMQANEPLTGSRLVALAENFVPTRPFAGDAR